MMFSRKGAFIGVRLTFSVLRKRFASKKKEVSLCLSIPSTQKSPFLLPQTSLYSKFEWNIRSKEAILANDQTNEVSLASHLHWSSELSVSKRLR